MSGCDIFLSHSSKDKAQVHRLAEDLRAAGLSVWLDEWEIKVGDPITQRIQHGLTNCSFVAIWLTEHAVNSGWVQREWQSKYNQEVSGNQVAVLPLLAGECELPLLLRDKKYADFRSSYEHGLKALLSVFRTGVEDAHHSTTIEVKGSADVSGRAGALDRPNESLIYVGAVDSAEKHGAMWRWDQRMFRSRHPRQYQEFDLVGLDLGRSWWKRYPEQDWVLRDWTHEQIGQYCLCPIRESTFSSLLSGKKKETDLVSKDIVDVREIHAHQFWYLSNFMRARVKAGIPPLIAEIASNVMIEHALKRAVRSDHFATRFGREISVVAFVEARSLVQFAEKHRFVKANPHSRDEDAMKIYHSVWERKHVDLKLNAVHAFLDGNMGVVRAYRDGSASLFQQPPNY